MNEQEILDELNKYMFVPERTNTEYTKACDEREAKYGGFNEVSASSADSIFESVVLPSLGDFVRIKKGLFVKELSGDFFHLIVFGRGRYSYGFTWGVSLSYVPHKWEGACKFHRTLKSARLDLFETDGVLIKDIYSAETLEYGATFFHGEKCFHDELVRAWKNLEPIIRNWFSSVTTLDDVLAKAKFQLNHPTYKGYHHHNPDPKLVYAFTLAKTGRFQEGLIALEELRKSQSSFYSSDELPKALRQIATM